MDLPHYGWFPRQRPLPSFRIRREDSTVLKTALLGFWASIPDQAVVSRQPLRVIRQFVVAFSDEHTADVVTDGNGGWTLEGEPVGLPDAEQYLHPETR